MQKVNLLIKLKQTVIVEGKYDKIALENILDATIITTNGFRIFKDREKRELIRFLAKKNGLIVITDSDSAGSIIRSHLKQICPADTIKNVYVPQILGKEKRKTKSSKEGLLGVEGLEKHVLLSALMRSGITSDEVELNSKALITKTNLFELGLSGGVNSSSLRYDLAKYLGLPTNMSCNAFLDCINAIYNNNEFFKVVELWQQEGAKR